VRRRPEGEGTGCPAFAVGVFLRTALRGLTEVAVVETADFGTLDDRPRRGELDGPGLRRILVEREMSAGPMIILEVAGQDAA